MYKKESTSQMNQYRYYQAASAEYCVIKHNRKNNVNYFL